jgi:uncharacterized protein YbaR (Trm112 family)
VALDDQLLDVLVCPETKDPLIYFEDENFLFSPSARLKYPIEDEIPVMLVDEAEEVSEEEAERLENEADERNLPKTAQPAPEEV